MNRRDLLLGGVALATVSAAAIAHEDSMEGHPHHHGDGKYGALIGALAQCVSTSRDCIAHCMALFEKGDTETARCARLAYDVQAICGTMMVLAHSDSQHLAEYAKVTAAMCRDCNEECKKHADKHEICKLCADACVECAEHCDKVV
jgi:Cys-rich four helix bundle protein (predicted Tat secretion target)